MQTTQNDILSFDASIKGGVKKPSASKQKGDKDGGEFLSMVLNAAANKGANLDEKDIKEIANAVNMSAQTAAAKAQTNVKSVDVKEILGDRAGGLFENATFMQLLQILEMLNGGEQISKYPNFSDRITKALSNEANLSELMGAKNLSELVEIANKLNLGLENISVTKEEAENLAKEFPNLAKKEFFTPVAPKQNLILNESVKTKVEETINSQKKEPQNTLNKLLQATQEVQEESVNLAPALKEEEPKKDEKKDTKKAEIKPQSGQILETKDKNMSANLDNKKINLQNLLYPERENEQNLEQTMQPNEEENPLNLSARDAISNARAVSKNLTAVKETFENFSSTLKEQVQNYKSPFMRFNITLNPLNLGEVEITMVNRGNNLHINFNSNTQTMNLFLQNQAEFKNSLVNMGFTELEMNFSDQGQRKEQGQKAYKKGSNFGGEDMTASETTATSLELILPRYV